MKVGLVKENERAAVREFFKECGWLAGELRKVSLSEVDFSLFEIFQSFGTKKPKRFLKCLVSHADSLPWQKVLMNLVVLLDHCADPELDVLDFNQELKAGFEAIELLREIDKVFSDEKPDTMKQVLMQLPDAYKREFPLEVLVNLTDSALEEKRL